MWLVYSFMLRGAVAAKHLFKRLLRSHADKPRKIVIDKLLSYGVTQRDIISAAIQTTDQYANDRAKQSHEMTRARKRGMRKFKTMDYARRFVTAHAAVSNLFDPDGTGYPLIVIGFSG
jgi:putative transposase